MHQAMTTDAPQRFLCPISMTVMSHPVRTEAGHVFERQAIMEWMYFGKATCPLSRKPLHPSSMKRDRVLEQEIRQWRLENNTPVEENEPEEDEDEDLRLTFSEQLPTSRHQPSEEKMTHLLSLRTKVLQNRDRRLAKFEKRSM